MRQLRESDVRAAAIVTSSTVDRNMVSELTDTGIPVVSCNSDPAGRFVSNFSIEYGPGIQKAIQHIVVLGHHSAAVISGPGGNRTAVTIKNALVTGLTTPGLKAVCVLESNYRVDAGASAVREVLSGAQFPTVLFCGNDLIAMGALEKSGVRISGRRFSHRN